MSNVYKSERRGIAGSEEIKDNRIKDNRNLWENDNYQEPILNLTLN